MGTVTSQVALSHPTIVTLQELGRGQAGKAGGRRLLHFSLEEIAA